MIPTASVFGASFNSWTALPLNVADLDNYEFNGPDMVKGGKRACPHCQGFLGPVMGFDLQHFLAPTWAPGFD